MAICQLWVRGLAENYGFFNVDVFVSYWLVNKQFPSLSQINSGTFGRGTFTRYAAEPAWQYNQAGWYSYPDFYLKGDCAIDPMSKFDCLNGGCISNTLYGTPGKYLNLANCIAGCAKDSTCAGECVPTEEIAALQAAAANVKPRLCN